MSKLKVALSVLGVVAIVAVASLLVYSKQKSTEPVFAGEFSFSTSSEVTNYGKAFLGSHVGTTTIGVDKNGGATTSYPIKIGRNKDVASINLKFTAVTSTNSGAVVVLGSNDFNCSTDLGPGAAATNTVMTNVNWFSAMDHLKGKVHSTVLVNTSSPVHWSNAVVGAGMQLILTDLNYECLRVDISGLSTTLYGEITTK